MKAACRRAFSRILLSSENFSPHMTLLANSGIFWPLSSRGLTVFLIARVSNLMSRRCTLSSCLHALQRLLQLAGLPALLARQSQANQTKSLTLFFHHLFKLVCNYGQKSPDIGDDSNGLGGASVYQLCDYRLADVHCNYFD